MLALYSNPKWLSVVRGTVERLTKILGFPDAQCRSIIRAVDEALSNILRHSYGNRLDHHCHVLSKNATPVGEGRATGA